jgi:hypothetical protein
MWKKGLNVTAVWMAAYAFFCMPTSLFFVLGSVSHFHAVNIHLLRLLSSTLSPPRTPRDLSRNTSHPTYNITITTTAHITTAPVTTNRTHRRLASQHASHPKPHGLCRRCPRSHHTSHPPYHAPLPPLHPPSPLLPPSPHPRLPPLLSCMHHLPRHRPRLASSHTSLGTPVWCVAPAVVRLGFEQLGAIDTLSWSLGL